MFKARSLKIFLFLVINLFSLFVNLIASNQKSFLVMIDPAGHAKNLGRRLIEGYERAQTFKFAQSLQKALQDKYKVRVILTRFPGEEIGELQNASFANRLNVDFYLNIHIYREESVKPKFFLYHLVYDQLVDFSCRFLDPCSFTSIQQAHFLNIQKTKYYAENIKNFLTQTSFKKHFDFYGFYGIPFKPLCGIVAPALAIELGICEEDRWQSFVDPLVESLSFLGNTDF